MLERGVAGRGLEVEAGQIELVELHALLSPFSQYGVDRGVSRHMPEFVHKVFPSNCVELARYPTRLELFYLVLIGTLDLVDEHGADGLDPQLLEHFEFNVLPRWDRLELCHLRSARLDPLLGILFIGDV